ncbi:MAG TPA: 2-dehydropantoate 2-reductase [Candidatus Baltobacteraceae bacterium]|nr:2-dehydropantoate 2-reductase [Candidatus Baltobacteraceae bacterium]
MRVAIVGAGAIGGFIGAALARAGEDVTFVARGEHLHAMRERGTLRVAASDTGPFEVEARAFSSLDEAPQADALLLTFKSHQWGGVLASIERALQRGAFVVTLQNGIPFWYDSDRALESVDPGGTIRAAIPDERIVGGIVHASGHVVEPGIIHQSGGMLYPLGELDGTTTERVTHLSRMFEAAGLQAPVEPVIRRNIWRKVMNNAALNPVSALTRSSIHPLLADSRIRELLKRLIEESIAVAKASGVDPQADAEERLRWAGHLADVKTSMLQDLEAGKQLELEPIDGAVVELAERYGVDVPALKTIYALTKLLERTVSA